jgi:hypothetical protein
MENLNYRKIFFEFVSISFAVFLGLMMNQCRDSYNNKQLANQLLNNILTEVTDNKELVSKLLDNHQYIIGEIDSVLFRHENGIDEGDISADLSFSIVNSTAWETAKLTQAIAYMDMDLVADIAGMYSYQDYYQSLVMTYVKDNILNSEMTKMLSGDGVEAIDELQRMRVFLSDISVMEEKLIGQYKEVLEVTGSLVEVQ